MKLNAQSIRPFIGAQNFEISRKFYKDLGFEESSLSPDMRYFDADVFGFYTDNISVLAQFHLV